MEAGHQTSLKVPNGGTMSGALPDGREREERGRDGERGREAEELLPPISFFSRNV